MLGLIYSIAFILIFLIFKHNEFILYLFIYILLLMLISYLILRFSNIFATILFIYSSTFIGIISLLYFSILIMFIISYITNSGNIPPLTLVGKEYLLQLAVYIPKYYPFILINLALSLLIQIIIIFLRPAYNLPKTKISFRFISVAFSVTTVSLLLFVGEIKNFFISQIYNLTPENLFKLTEVLGNNLETFITDTFIQRMITVSFLPYSIGSYICLYIIELKENRNRKRANKYYYAAFNHYLKNEDDKTYINLRKCLYFGGDYYELIVFNTPEFRPYINQIGFFEKIENSVRQDKVFKKLIIKFLKEIGL